VVDTYRADILLVEQQLSSSRTHAQSLIRAGCVYCLDSGARVLIKKASQLLHSDSHLVVEQDEQHRYVSRGGLKLAYMLERANISVAKKIALDVGQSTGGFSDCLLQAGAGLVVGVDVGHGQLATILRERENLICLEGINARSLPATQLLDYTNALGFDLAVMDVSFISQSLILPNLIPLIKPGGYLISLVKPQFEVGKAGIGKNGLVKNTALYQEVEQRLKSLCVDGQLSVEYYCESPITGGDGNREFLLCARRL